VLARASSLGSAGRQGSQTSLLEQFASQAKELVKETTRQSSHDGLLAHMDKVSWRRLSALTFINITFVIITFF